MDYEDEPNRTYNGYYLRSEHRRRPGCVAWLIGLALLGALVVVCCKF